MVNDVISAIVTVAAVKHLTNYTFMFFVRGEAAKKLLATNGNP